jgi:hypothetical protein
MDVLGFEERGEGGPKGRMRGQPREVFTRSEWCAATSPNADLK